MKIGALRRIDNLGRIVIPKSIRKILKIKSGDNLQIFIDGKNITIKKYSELEKLKTIQTTLKQTLEDLIKKEIYITDREKVLIPIINNPQLKEEIIDIIELRKLTIKKEEIQNKKKITTIIPIIVNGDIYGSVMIFSKELLTEENLSTAKAVIKLIEKTIED